MNGRTALVVSLLFTLLAPLFFGCSSAPPCTVSPIEIEETREDVKTLDKSLQEARQKVKELRARLAEKKKEFESKKDKPAELRKKVEELKKGSGRG